MAEEHVKGSRRLAAGLLVAGLLIAVGGAALLLVLSKNPSAASANGGSGIDIELVVGEAGRLMREGKPDEAVERLEMAIQREPAEQPLRLALGRALVMMNDTTGAYQQYEKAIAIGPTDAALQFEAGLMASKAALPDRAVEHFSMARTDEPSNARYALFLGMAQLKVGDDRAAMATLMQAARLDPDSAEAWGTMAQLELKENRLGPASELVERARTLQPDVARWKITEATIVKRQGDAQGALDLVLSLDPAQRQQRDVLRLTEECYGLLGEPEKAAAAWEEAARASWTDGSLWLDAALAQERIGDRAKALEFAERAESLGAARATDVVRHLRGSDGPVGDASGV